MSENVEEAIKKIREIEEMYDVTIVARGGAYGSSRLVIIDNRDNQEYSPDDYE
jgi:hypothetical protein